MKIKKEERPSLCGQDIEGTGFSYTLSIIGGKYKMAIIYWIAEKNVVRYNELKRLLGAISHKMLSSTLKELEADGIVERKAYPEVPPRVEYRLTTRGRSLVPVLDAMCYWGVEHKQSAVSACPREAAG